MTLEEIKRALDEGKKVFHQHEGYPVIKDRIGQYLITYKYNEWAIGLTHQDGRTMNGKEEEFYIG